MRNLAKLKTRCQLRGFDEPVSITSIECPKCSYHILQSDYCNRCGLYVEVPTDYEEGIVKISYKQYVDWALSNFDNYVIYEIQNKALYTIVLLAREEDLEDFIESSPFKNTVYQKRKVKVRDLKAFLIKTDNRLVLTMDEWHEIR